jgi:predicted nucleic acid-binding protein
MMVDASPLIYLAKLDALDVLAAAGQQPLLTPEVERETARVGLAYVYPDASLIAEALRSGVLRRTELTREEAEGVEGLMAEAGGLDQGEAEVLAVAARRSLPVLLFERRAIRLARSVGLPTWSPLRLLAAGTPNRRLLRQRMLGFARLVDMRFEQLERLLQEIEDDDD